MDENLNLEGNTEIEKALKEFEVKNPEQAQKAPQLTSAIPQKEAESITFDTDSYKAVKFYSETDTPKVVKLVMKWSGGAIKEQKQAEWILLAFVIVAIGVSLYLVIGTRSGPKPAVPSISGTPIEKTSQGQLP